MASAVATFLGIALSRFADICNALCMWETTKTQVRVWMQNGCERRKTGFQKKKKNRTATFFSVDKWP